MNNGNNFLFTADLHLKLKFKDVPYTWLVERYIEFCHWIENQRIQTGAQALVVGGDWFDHQPSLYELALFPTIFEICNFNEYLLYPGNHEMATKERSFYSEIHKILGNRENVSIIYDKIGYWYDWQVIPYPLIKSVKSVDKKVMSHVRCKSDKGLYEAEIDFSIFENCECVLLGDIHTCRSVGDNVKYPGSPYDTAFSTLPLTDRYIIHYNNGNVSNILRDDKFQRLVKLETTPEKYEGIKQKIAESKNRYDISVVIESLADMNLVQDSNVKKKLKLDKDSALTTSDIYADIRTYLLDVLKVDVLLADRVMTRLMELGGNRDDN